MVSRQIPERKGNAFHIILVGRSMLGKNEEKNTDIEVEHSVSRSGDASNTKQ